MATRYDEDLSDNHFFRELQADHAEILSQAPVAGWVVCIPRIGTARRHCLTEQDFLAHILVPSDELPETQFQSLSEKNVRVCNGVVSVEQPGSPVPHEVHILFEEIFYTKQLLKYRVWCVDFPLDPNAATDVPAGTLDSNFNNISTLRECIDLIWTESMGKNILENIDSAILAFIENSHDIENYKLQKQKDCVGALYTKCLQIVFANSRVRDKANTNRHLHENLKLSVETYMLHGIYKHLFNAINVCTSFEDARLNKIIRNLSDIQLIDLAVRKDLYETVPYAKQALARIEIYTTVLGKVSCIRRTINIISKKSQGNKELYLTVDDFLPVLVFLVLKTGLANWMAQLTFMKQFRFSNSSEMAADESSFLITSLEAAIEHIRSEALIGPSLPESQLNYEKTDSEGEQNKDTDSDITTLADLFEEIRLGHDNKVEVILKHNSVKSIATYDVALNNINGKAIKNPMVQISKTLSIEEILNDDKPKSLCHPLCTCSNCQKLLSARILFAAPTASSCDDRGLTPLHIAAIHGRPQIVDILLNYAADVKIADYRGCTGLHYGAQRGHQNVVLLLLHAGANIAASNIDGDCALHLAANNGHEGCVKALLYFAEHCRLDLNVNAKNNSGDTALHLASRWGYEGIVKILIEYGANASSENKRKFTPIDFAQNLNISRLLIASNIQAKENEQRNPKEYLFKTDIEEIDENKTQENDVNTCGVKPESTDQIKRVERLLRAIAFGDTKLACYYLGIECPSGIEVQKTSQSADISSCHPLCTCDRCIEVSSMSKLHSTSPKKYEKMNINVCNSEGLTALHVAALNGRGDLSALILDYGALPNIASKKGLTPLHLACQHQCLTIVKQLLSCGTVNVDAADRKGNTALHLAVKTGNTKLVETVLSQEPNLKIRNLEGKTPLKEAEEKMYFAIVKLLKQASIVKNESED